MKPIIIGVAGGSGSGKTTVVRTLVEQLGPDEALVIQHDSYYKDQSHVPADARNQLNFDHPDALDTPLLVSHLKTLLEGGPVDIPVYDFTTHTRTHRTRTVEAKKLILLDGILILAESALRGLMDLQLFVDTDADVRFIRRLDRDLHERRRTLESVIEQYLSTVRPMHLEFVEPSKRCADLIIPEGGDNTVAIDVLVGKIRSLLSGTSAFTQRIE